MKWSTCFTTVHGPVVYCHVFRSKVAMIDTSTREFKTSRVCDFLCLSFQILFSSFTMARLPRSARRHTRIPPARLASFSFLFLAFVAVICLCPLAVKADDKPHPEYGTVIGIGTISQTRKSSFSTWLIPLVQIWVQRTP
jgi:hypothetical protein